MACDGVRQILGNMALLMVLMFAKLMIKLFLTELSHQEVEVRGRQGCCVWRAFPC